MVVEKAISVLLSMSDDALNTKDENIDPTFELDASMKSDADHIAENFCEDWVSYPKRVSLGLFLCFQLTKHVELGDTKAAKLAGIMIGGSDKTGASNFLRMENSLRVKKGSISARV